MKVVDVTLPVPPAVTGASKAMEIARIWLVDGDQHVVLSPNLWKDSASWGLMLVDLARHVASALSRRDMTVLRFFKGFGKLSTPSGDIRLICPLDRC
jgi:hypothetical protein